MLHIVGCGHAHPPTEITTAFLVSLDTGTTAEWIEKYIGIDVRRTVLPLDYLRDTKNQDPRAAIEAATHSPTDLGAAAARMALARAGLAVDQIGLVIANCCAPRQTTPSEAQRIACALELAAPAFDVFTACPAFALHLDLLSSYRPERLPEYTLCVSTACVTETVNYSDRTDGAIWGDGAAAWIVAKDDARGLRVLETSYQTDPKRCQAVIIDRQGFFGQDGRAVRHFSTAQTVRLLRRLERDFEIDWAKTTFIGHQANFAMLSSICKNRGIPDAQHWTNVRDRGNQAGAGAPATLSMHWDELQPGQRIAVAVVGAGLSWGSAVLEAV